MSGHQNLALESTVYLYFAANDTSGSGGDGATPLYDVRLGGAAASAAPVLSGTPDLLTHANYPAGAHEIAVAATTGNGFTDAGVYGVFCTLAIDSQNPTGFVGSFTLTALATSAQLGNLATGSAAISVVAESDVVTTGGETNTYAVTDEVDGVYHEVTDVGGAMELYYQFDVGGNGVAATCQFTGRLNSANDSIGVFAYNWAATSWDQVGTLSGTGGTADGVEIFNLLTRHTGTAANLGKVRIRGYAASGLTSATLYLDQAIISYAVVAQSVGYAQGRIWGDTADGTAGTEVYVNGVADKKSLTFADMLTLGTALGIHEYNFSPDSTLTLAASLIDAVVYGIGYELDFSGQDASHTHFYHSGNVHGIVLSTTGHVDVFDSILQAITCDDMHYTNCTWVGTTTLGSVAGDIRVVNCRSGIAGATTPILDFGTASANHNVFFADWQNGIEIQNFNAATGGGADLLSISGMGKLVIDSTCDGGTINLRGLWQVVGLSVFEGKGGTVTFDDGHQDLHDILIDTAEIGTAGAGLTDLGGMSTGMKAEVNVEADTALTDYDPPTNAEMEARTPAAGELAYIVRHAATAKPVTFTGGTTTTAILGNVDGVAASSTDDAYNSRLLVFNAGTLDEQVCQITDYVGSTTTATISAVTTAVTSSHTAVLV